MVAKYVTELSVQSTKPELADAAESIKSVRSLPRKAALLVDGGTGVRVPEEQVLRPRAYVFGFKSEWKKPESFRKAFVDVARDISDDLRPNGVCVLEQAVLIRRPYTLKTVSYFEHALLHFFIHLVQAIDSRPDYTVELSKYFTDDYGIGKRPDAGVAGR
jgi:hypothetical protein